VWESLRETRYPISRSDWQLRRRYCVPGEIDCGSRDIGIYIYIYIYIPIYRGKCLPTTRLSEKTRDAIDRSHDVAIIRARGGRDVA